MPEAPVEVPSTVDPAEPTPTPGRPCSAPRRSSRPGVTSARCIEVNYSGNVDPQAVRLYAAAAVRRPRALPRPHRRHRDSRHRLVRRLRHLRPGRPPVQRHPGRLRAGARRLRHRAPHVGARPRMRRFATFRLHGVGPGRAGRRGEDRRVRLLLGNPGRRVSGRPSVAAPAAVAAGGRRAGRRPTVALTQNTTGSGRSPRSDGRHRELGDGRRRLLHRCRAGWTRCPIPPSPPCDTALYESQPTSTGPPTSRSGSSRRPAGGPAR